METIQVVLDGGLLKAADQAARRLKVNRSALIRDAVREHLRRLELRELERQEIEAYQRTPDDPEEFAAWDKVAAWPKELARGDVRLFRFAPPDKQRPVVVLTRASIVDHLARVTVAPVTSAIRGVASEVALGTEDGLKQPCAINLHNIVTVPKEGLGRHVGQLSDRRLEQVCAAIAYALGCRR